MTILQRPSLVYPGTPPGVDWSHPAAAANGFPVFACVALPSAGNFLDAVSNSLPTGFGGTKPTAKVDATLGSVQVTTGIGNEGVLFTKYPANLSLPALTLAVILRPTSISVNSCAIETSNQFSSGNGSALFYTSSGFLGIEDRFGDFAISAIVQLVAGHPYFIGLSALKGANGTVNFVARDLSTGQIQTDSIAGTASQNAIFLNSAIEFGQGDIPKSVNGNTAAAFFSANFLSVPQLVQWAQSPWSLWYPYAGTMRPAWFSQGASGGGGFVPAWAVPSNRIPSGGYAT